MASATPPTQAGYPRKWAERARQTISASDTSRRNGSPPATTLKRAPPAATGTTRTEPNRTQSSTTSDSRTSSSTNSQGSRAATSPDWNRQQDAAHPKCGVEAIAVDDGRDSPQPDRTLRKAAKDPAPEATADSAVMS